MLKLCLLFSTLIVLMQQGDLAVQARSPFLLRLSPSLSQHERMVKRTMQTESVETEITWQTECSPHLAGVRRGQDTLLQCKVIAPSGTQLTWFKGQHRLQRPGVSHELSNNILLEAMEEETNMVGFEETSLVSPVSDSSSARLLISSTVYIDCADDQDAAEYSLEVRTPSNNVYFRNFTVFLTDMGQLARSCRFEDHIPYLPRIYQHSSAALAEVGGALTLPCRAQGFYTLHSWHVNNTQISHTDTNHQVLANGDLVIRRVNQHGPVRYMCRVSSTRYPAFQDAIFTDVSPQVQDQ
ncbi:uncharacterized protein [Panulirus ornatus]|uniref:uncharacterized protein n=1 Tax=Panulirus ornatus TaxID=150431 RepID=UPI003A875EED